MEEIKKSQDRVNVLNKIEEYEQNGWFDRDVEDDPPSRTLQPDEVDYLNKKLKNKIATKYAYSMGKKFLDKIIKEKTDNKRNYWHRKFAKFKIWRSYNMQSL